MWNVVDNQIARSLTSDVARFMLSHLERNSFFLGSLQEEDPKAARSELSSLLARLMSIVPPPVQAHAFLEYSYDLLVLNLQKGVEAFRIPLARLSLPAASRERRRALSDWRSLWPGGAFKEERYRYLQDVSKLQEGHVPKGF
jgi:hypothetical protein